MLLMNLNGEKSLQEGHCISLGRTVFLEANLPLGDFSIGEFGGFRWFKFVKVSRLVNLVISGGLHWWSIDW